MYLRLDVSRDQPRSTMLLLYVNTVVLTPSLWKSQSNARLLKTSSLEEFSQTVTTGDLGGTLKLRFNNHHHTEPFMSGRRTAVVNSIIFDREK